MAKHFARYSHVYWLSVFGLLVLAPELYGVFNDVPGDTISETWWWIFHTNDTTTPIWVKLIGVVVSFGLFGWLIFHFAFGWWGGPQKPHFPPLTPELLHELKVAYTTERTRAVEGTGTQVYDQTPHDAGLEAVYELLQEKVK